MILKTERLILRPWCKKDARALYRYAKDPVIGLNAGWQPHLNVRYSRFVIEKFLSVAETYAVCLKENGAVIGSIGLHHDTQMTESSRDAEIGFWLGVPFWGNGYIPEAVNELIRHAFCDLPIDRLWCGHYDGNENSKRVQEKCGFVYHHSADDFYIPQLEEHRKGHAYLLTRETWAKTHPSAYRIIRPEDSPKAELFRHFSKDCKCSVSITQKIDVTALYEFSKRSDTKFYLNFLYLLSAVLNSRDDYRLFWRWETEELLRYDRIHPMQYVFHEDTETFSVVYTEYDPDYKIFYERALADLERGKRQTAYGLHDPAYPNWFDASCVPWLCYDALHIELPDGYLYLAPIVNWGKFKEENGRLMMPLTVRLNHAVGDGYLISRVFAGLEEKIGQILAETDRIS